MLEDKYEEADTSYLISVKEETVKEEAVKETKKERKKKLWMKELWKHKNVSRIAIVKIEIFRFGHEIRPTLDISTQKFCTFFVMM